MNAPTPSGSEARRPTVLARSGDGASAKKAQRTCWPFSTRKAVMALSRQLVRSPMASSGRRARA